MNIKKLRTIYIKKLYNEHYHERYYEIYIMKTRYSQ